MSEICFECNERFVDGVTCHGCNNNLHYKCSGLSESTYRKMTSDKKSNWRCLGCRKTVAASVDAEPTLAQVLLEIQSFRKEFNYMKGDVECTKNTVHEIQQNWLELESHLTKIDRRMDDVENQMKSFPKMKQELESAHSTILYLQDTIEQKDQLSRLNNLEILGVPFKKGENLYSILHDISTKVGFDLQESDVNYVSRVRRYPESREGKIYPREPAIVVGFTQRRRKDKLLAAVRSRRGLNTADVGFVGPSIGIFVHEHLTPRNKILLNRTRAFKEENNYSFVWVRDCNDPS